MKHFAEMIKHKIEALPPFIWWLGRLALSMLATGIVYVTMKNEILASVAGGAVYFSYLLKKQPNEA